MPERPEEFAEWLARVPGNIPPGWWEQETLDTEEFQALKAAARTLPRPPGLGPPGSTFDLTSEQDSTTED
jgi:hypothetical protein